MRYLSDRLVLVAGAGGLAVFEAALAAGAPWGAWSWGGAHPGVLPTGLRVSSAVSAIGWAAAAAAVARTDLPPGRAARRGLAALSALGAAGAVVNLASASLPERMLWTPVSAAIALAAWRARAAQPEPRPASFHSRWRSGRHTPQGR